MLLGEWLSKNFLTYVTAPIVALSLKKKKIRKLKDFS